MSARLESMANALRARFSGVLRQRESSCGELSFDLDPSELLATATALRDEEAFSFASFIDVCGVDYLGYGQVQWRTEQASETGFSRAVEPGATVDGAAASRSVGEPPANEPTEPGATADGAAASRSVAEPPANEPTEPDASADGAEASRSAAEPPSNEPPSNEPVEAGATVDGAEAGVSLGNGDRQARFAAVYHLLSLQHNLRLRLRVFARGGNPPLLPSVTPVWKAADWFEREAFDLFGIVFEGHGDLRRILTDYGFIGHPFRKDFPLSGKVEVRYDEAKRRVVYEPVSIEPRILVPRVIRDDNRYRPELKDRPAGGSKAEGNAPGESKAEDHPAGGSKAEGNAAGGSKAEGNAADG